MSKISTFIRREPMVHFTILAVLLFVAHAYWADAGKEVIRVDSAAQDFLIQQRSDLLLRPLTRDEKQEVIDNYVEEEILWHEARERGLDQTARIRQQMIRGIRFLLMSDVPTPTEAELRSFYESDKERFTPPPALTLDHVFFTNAFDVPADLLN